MALGEKKSGTIHSLDERGTEKLKQKYDLGIFDDVTREPDDHPMLSSVLYQMKLLQEDIEELRRFSGTEESTRITNNTNNIPPVTVTLTPGLSLRLEPSIDTRNRRYLLGIEVVDSNGKEPVRYRGSIQLT